MLPEPVELFVGPEVLELGVLGAEVFALGTLELVDGALVSAKVKPQTKNAADPKANNLANFIKIPF